MADPIPMQKTAYHIEQGAVIMYAIDADSAVARFPEEWSHEPWPGAEDKPADKSQVVIPDDWRSFNPQKRRMLAIKLGAPNNVKVADATQTIEDEVARRKAPRPQPQPPVQPPLQPQFDPVTGDRITPAPLSPPPKPLLP